MNSKTRHIFLPALKGMLISILLLTVISCEDDVPKGSFIQANDLNISSYLNEAEGYAIFTSVLKEADLYYTLDSYNPYGNGFTVFAPTDEAFLEFFSNSELYSSADDLIEDEEFLKILIGFHIAMSAYTSNEFPFGALNDSTVTGDYLTIGTQTSESGSYFLVNNYARVIDPNIQLSNGWIHGIDKVLEPITMNSYDWLKNRDGTSIFTELLEQTEVFRLMGLQKLNDKNKLVQNSYTLFVEPDSVFNKRGIESFDDLVEKFGTPGMAHNNTSNTIYKFAAYHILEQTLFLDDMASGIYNTFTSLPVKISSGAEIKLNPGFKIIDTYVYDGDTITLDYVPIIYELSNNPSKNGPVHYVSELLEIYKPGAGRNTFHFKSEPVIDELKDSEGRFSFEDPSEFEVIHWEGTKEMIYAVGSDAADAWEDDFLELDGPFIFAFNTPRIFPGSYDFMIRVHSADYDNAVIQVYLDGKRMGANLNLKSSGSNNDFVVYTIGSVEFLDYSSHEIKINTIIPGKMQLDMIRFEP